MEIILAMMIILLIIIIAIEQIKTFIVPKIIEKTTTIVEKNPRWITPKLRLNYYGFSNVDIVTVKNCIGELPRFRLIPRKNKKDIPRLEVLISEDTPVNDIDRIAQMALRGKIYIFYGVTTPDKSASWLSALLYMLEGGNIDESVILKINKNMEDNRQETN